VDNVLALIGEGAVVRRAVSVARHDDLIFWMNVCGVVRIGDVLYVARGK
jgi:hypothetical protein